VRWRTEHFAPRGYRRWSLVPYRTTKEAAMNITLTLAPLISLIAGILILVMPRLLNYIVAAYLIVVGLLGLFGGVHLR
jgi:cobalamin synthase